MGSGGVSPFFLLLLWLHCVPGADPNGGGKEKVPPPPGHLQPLGSHVDPGPVLEISHLPTPAEFHERYVLPKVPLLMRGALTGDVWKRWQNDQYLRENFGEDEVGIEEGKKENRSDPRYTMTMSKFLDLYQSDDIYMVDNLPPPMYMEWQVPRPLSCGGFTENFMYTHMWFSSGGTRSVLHTDSYENLHCLVSGRKEFVLIEPHYADVIGPEHARFGYYGNLDVERVNMTAYPNLSSIPWYRAVVEEGDCLYLPYLWIHSVNSFHRNMGVNIWWTQFDFDAGQCPAEIPEYFRLGDVQLAPELMVVEALGRVARSDKSVRVEELYAHIQKYTEMSFIQRHHFDKLFEILEPGCGGIIKNYKVIPRSNLKEAYQYVTDIPPPAPPRPPPGDELYDLPEEFGGQSHAQEDDDYFHDHDDQPINEGGGDSEFHHHYDRDEL